MKLSKFNALTIPKQMGRTSGSLPKIAFGKNGIITFNKAAATLMGLSENDKVQLAQDEDDPANWYISKDTDGFEVRSSGKNEQLIFNHKALVSSFMEAFEFTADKSRTFLISGEATTIDKTKYWGILVTND